MSTDFEKRQKICVLLRRAKIVADDVNDALTSYLISVALDEAESRSLDGEGPAGAVN